MTPSARPRPAVTFLGLLILLCALTGPAFALDLLKDVSKAEAKELGITVRVTPREKDVRVQVDFKPTGPKKEFKYAYLEVTRGGKRLVLAYVMPWKPTPDTTHFEFYTDPAALPETTFTVTVWDDPITGQGYVLRMKDYLPERQSAKGEAQRAKR